jgi:hypothetical protein
MHKGVLTKNRKNSKAINKQTKKMKMHSEGNKHSTPKGLHQKEKTKQQKETTLILENITWGAAPSEIL